MNPTFVEISSIALICLVIGQAVKVFKSIPTKFIPVIVSIAGGLLGLAGMKAGIPNLVDMNAYDAIATGIFSGISSSGLFSLYKNIIGAYEGNN